MNRRKFFQAFVLATPTSLAAIRVAGAPRSLTYILPTGSMIVGHAIRATRIVFNPGSRLVDCTVTCPWWYRGDVALPGVKARSIVNSFRNFETAPFWARVLRLGRNPK